MAQLTLGTRIQTITGNTVRVFKLLGSGGQGDVYLVDYAGKKMALKWYKRNVFAEPTLFAENLRNNIRAGSPTPEFLWPLDLTQQVDGTFGYIMELRPPSYKEASEFFLHHVYFPSFKRAVDACLSIVTAFRVLHNAGYSYQDINGGNFFIEPNSGRVLICDNDNVAINGTKTGVLGTPRFMAPEVVMGDALPNVQSDRHSMAVLLFMLLCMNHPLEGKRSLVPALDANMQRKLYGSDALFILDPNDRANEPDRKVHHNALAVWACLPQHLRDIFCRSFSQQALKNPNRRPSEAEWMYELVRFRSEIVRCRCGNEMFVEDGARSFCERCGTPADVPFVLELPSYKLPGIRDTRLYRCQTCVCAPEVALDPIASVTASQRNNQVRLGIRNVSTDPWEATTSKGDKRTVDPGAVIPLRDGVSFTANDQTVRIVSNATSSKE